MPLIQYITYKNISIFEVSKKILTARNLNIDSYLCIDNTHCTFPLLILEGSSDSGGLRPRGEVPGEKSVWGGGEAQRWLRPLPRGSRRLIVSLLRESCRHSLGFLCAPPPLPPVHPGPVRAKGTGPLRRRDPCKARARRRTEPPEPPVYAQLIQLGPQRLRGSAPGSPPPGEAPFRGKND